MTPVVPSSTGSSATSGGPSASPAPTTAPSAAPADFLQLLAQIVGEPAQQAITPVGTPTLIAPDLEEEGELDAESLSWLPMSLPLVPGGMTMTAQQGALGKSEAIGVQLSGRSGAMSADVQLLTEMIQSEQSMSRDEASGLDSFQLSAASTESLNSTKTQSAADLMLSRTIHTPVGSKQWADEIGSRLTMMTEQGKQSASIRLSPEHLGPLEIRIAIKEDQASVWFGAAHADTRAAIEHALPRLRELFESQGMSLADAGVFHEAPREQPKTTSNGSSSGESNSATESLSSQVVRINVGLVDAYA